MAVLASPSEVWERAWLPNAVLFWPPKTGLRLWSVPVPPAVFEYASLTVGLQPGATQTGVWPQLGVMFSSMTRPVTTGTRRANGVMASSMRRMIPAQNEGTGREHRPQG